MNILGINAYHGDASAAIIVDGKLIAAAEEERFNRIRHSAGFPEEAVKYCLRETGLSIKNVDYIAVPKAPAARILKKLYYAIQVSGLAVARFSALSKMQRFRKTLADIFNTDEKKIKAKIINVEHHRAHIASSFFVSPFEQAMLFSSDGFGDFASTVWAIGQGNKIEVLGEVSFPYSLGIYYTALTQYLGFLDYGDEYKVMGLAAYGEPEFQDEFKKILISDRTLGFKLNLDYFLHHKKLVDMNFETGEPKLGLLYSTYLEERLGRHRENLEPIELRHKNIASSLQKRLEEVIFSHLNSFYRVFQKKSCDNLCLSGGVAFNCSMNGKIFNNTAFKRIYVQPAAGDAGLAIGAAYYLWNHRLSKTRSFVMEHAYWGMQHSLESITSELRTMGGQLNERNCEIKKINTQEKLCKIAAKAIAEGKILGWFQGRMEWGPRALGNRSILADPRKKEVKDLINSRIKHREYFRPFAPSVLEEYVGEYFKLDCPSPFMSFTYTVREEKKALIPAVVHIDGSARIQTVNKNINPLFWQLIEEFRKLTGIPLLLNTSFNENEPIVCSPRQAIDCFLHTEIDTLVIGSYILKKQEWRLMWGNKKAKANLQKSLLER